MHHWANIRRHAPQFREPSNAFDRTCALLCPEDRNDGVAGLLQGHVRPETVRDWRRGRRRPPVWAIEVLQDALKARVRQETQSIEELEKEKKAGRCPLCDMRDYI